MTTSPIIVRRNGNQYIPNDYLELLLKTHSAAYSAALVSTEGETKELLVTKGDGDGLNVELIQETMKSFPLDDITFCFYASDKALSMDDINPFTLLKGQVVAFVSGEFPGYDKPTSSKSSEFFFAHEYLKPKLEMLSELVDGNLEKIVTAIGKPNFKTDALNNAPSHGVITLMCADNTTVSFAKTEDASEFPWGWVSNTLGYGGKSSKKEGETTQKKGMFSGRSTVREKVGSNGQPTPSEPPKPAKSDAVTATAEALKANALENYTVKKGNLPPEHLSRKDRGKWYLNRLGYKPDKWDQGKGVPIELYVNPQGQIMTLSDVKKLGLAAANLPARNNPARSGKDTENENISNGQMDNAPPAGEKNVLTERLPVMSPRARQHFEAYLKEAKVQKKIAENADIITDPTHVQAIEKKFAGFATQMGWKDMGDVCKLSYDMCVELTFPELKPGEPNKWFNPEIASVLLFSLKNMVASNYAKQAKKVDEQVTTHVVANEELKPEKKGMFAKRAAA